MTRKLFGQPIRWTTELRYVNKLTLEEFAEVIRLSVLGWKGNLEHLDEKFKSQEMYPEEWAQSLLGWMEIEVE